MQVTFNLPTKIKVKHAVSGVEGILTTRITRINGCVQYIISPPRKEDGTEVPTEWADIEDLLVQTPSVVTYGGLQADTVTFAPVSESEFKDYSEVVNFKFNTGDKVHNLLHGKQGHITIARVDSNGCIGYWYETGEQHPENGTRLEYYGFEQEFEFVSEGLNQKNLEKKKTGCAYLSAPPK